MDQFSRLLLEKDNNLSIILIECTRAMKFGKSTFWALITSDIIHAGFRANLVRWITENNRPVNIINDRALRDLLLSGRPNIELPSHFTITRDIRASFEKCQERIGTLLQVCDHIHVNLAAESQPAYRNMMAVFILPPMHGLPRTTAHSLHGLSIWNIKVK